MLTRESRRAILGKWQTGYPLAQPAGTKWVFLWAPGMLLTHPGSQCFLRRCFCQNPRKDASSWLGLGGGGGIFAKCYLTCIFLRGGGKPTNTSPFSSLASQDGNVASWGQVGGLCFNFLFAPLQPWSASPTPLHYGLSVFFFSFFWHSSKRFLI